MSSFAIEVSLAVVSMPDFLCAGLPAAWNRLISGFLFFTLLDIHDPVLSGGFPNRASGALPGLTLRAPGFSSPRIRPKTNGYL
jgi:hypothetical protein